MKLDRNINKNGLGKYALVKLRITGPLELIPDGGNGHVEIPIEALDYGDNPDSEFFVIRLKDRYAGPALESYSIHARKDDLEYSNEVQALAEKSYHHTKSKKPD